jgi:hypothetical protein
MKHHRGQRHPTNVTVQIFTRPATIGQGRVLNISPTGAFLETQLPLQPLSLIYLLPDAPPTDTDGARIAATVVRLAGTGVGLEWYEFAAETTGVYARLCGASADLVDAPELPLPTVPDLLLTPRAASRSLELLGVFRLESLR